MLAIANKTLGNITICGVLCLAVLSCATAGDKPESNTPITLATLYSSYGIPSDCGSAAAWEGKTVSLQAYVDPDNIFEKERYPDLPYEKFRLIDRNGKSIEVWVKASESRAIFSKVYERGESPLIVTGRLGAVRMSIMGKCQLGAKVWIDDPSQIQ